MTQTESQNPRTMAIDSLPTLEILQVINDEDQKVALAVNAVLPQIARAVDAIVHAIENGGRLFYVGAGASGRTGVIDAVECVPPEPKKNGEQALGGSRGGFSCKIHVTVDSLGNPLRFVLTAGQRHDSTQAQILVGRL